MEIFLDFAVVNSFFIGISAKNPLSFFIQQGICNQVNDKNKNQNCKYFQQSTNKTQRSCITAKMK